jgi:hypothetical protein
MDIYKSRERGREDVSINTGISERRKSLALSGDIYQYCLQQASHHLNINPTGRKPVFSILLEPRTGASLMSSLALDLWVQMTIHQPLLWKHHYIPHLKARRLVTETLYNR